MLIEFADVEDVDSWLGLLELVKENFPGVQPEDHRNYLLERIDYYSALVVKEQHTVVGALGFSPYNLELEFLAVHPQYRRKGISKALIHFMLAQFPKETEITVVTYREDDEKGKAARKLYESMGFTAGELITVFGYPCQEFKYMIR